MEYSNAVHLTLSHIQINSGQVNQSLLLSVSPSTRANRSLIPPQSWPSCSQSRRTLV